MGLTQGFLITTSHNTESRKEPGSDVCYQQHPPAAAPCEERGLQPAPASHHNRSPSSSQETTTDPDAAAHPAHLLRPHAPHLPPAPLPQGLRGPGAALSRTLQCPGQDMGQLCKS